ncbi:MAG: hypothetical protein VXZ15_11585, partial [Planctomycetota bacterium]|nr:hypothetical protein [Planctomycetota bacterium]
MERSNRGLIKCIICSRLRLVQSPCDLGFGSSQLRQLTTGEGLKMDGGLLDRAFGAQPHESFR